MELQIIFDRLDPLSGRAMSDRYGTTAFTGWLELMEHVERIREECRETPPGTPSDSEESGRALRGSRPTWRQE